MYVVWCRVGHLQDGTVKVWQWLEGRQLSSTQVGKELGGGGREGGAGEGVTREMEAVTKVCCSSHDQPLIVASVERWGSRKTSFPKPQFLASPCHA